MPKILQKNIYSAIVIVALIGLFVIVAVATGLLQIKAINGLFFGLNYLLCMLGVYNCSISHTIPSYIFVAPYSFEQRNQMIRHYMRSIYFALYISIFCVMALIAILELWLTKSCVNPLVLLAEMCLLFSILRMNGYAPYLKKVNRTAYIILCLANGIIALLMAGVEIFDMSLTETFTTGLESYKVDVIFVIYIILQSAILMLVYYKKYYADWIWYMTDYEKNIGLKEKEKNV